MTGQPRLDERAAETRALRERLKALEAALDWAAHAEPTLIEQIRRRAAKC